MWGKKTEQALSVLKEADAYKRATDHALARNGAKAYCDKLNNAIDVLVDFDNKRVPAIEDIQDMKKSLSKSGTACCLMSLPNGFMALVDSDGKLIATCMNGASITEREE